MPDLHEIYMTAKWNPYGGHMAKKRKILPFGCHMDGIWLAWKYLHRSGKMPDLHEIFMAFIRRPSKKYYASFRRHVNTMKILHTPGQEIFENFIFFWQKFSWFFHWRKFWPPKIEFIFHMVKVISQVTLQALNIKFKIITWNFQTVNFCIK